MELFLSRSDETLYLETRLLNGWSQSKELQDSINTLKSYNYIDFSELESP